MRMAIEIIHHILFLTMICSPVLIIGMEILL